MAPTTQTDVSALENVVGRIGQMPHTPEKLKMLEKIMTNLREMERMADSGRPLSTSSVVPNAKTSQPSDDRWNRVSNSEVKDKLGDLYSTVHKDSRPPIDPSSLKGRDRVRDALGEELSHVRTERNDAPLTANSLVSYNPRLSTIEDLNVGSVRLGRENNNNNSNNSYVPSIAPNSNGFRPARPTYETVPTESRVSNDNGLMSQSALTRLQRVDQDLAVASEEVEEAARKKRSAIDLRFQNIEDAIDKLSQMLGDETRSRQEAVVMVREMADDKMTALESAMTKELRAMQAEMHSRFELVNDRMSKTQQDAKESKSFFENEIERLNTSIDGIQKKHEAEKSSMRSHFTDELIELKGQLDEEVRCRSLSESKIVDVLNHLSGVCSKNLPRFFSCVIYF